jgi:glycoside/pentoside/hexuronide:cation symporter, GPH family
MASQQAAADRLPTGLKIGWGAGSIGTITVLNVNALLLLFFMASVLGLPPALAGTLLFGAKLVDAVAAPIVGALSDRTRSRLGRRRPYLLAGAFVCAVAVGAVFNPPDLPQSGLVAYLAACLLLLALGYTLFNVPYLAMPAEMTDSPAERTSIMSWRIAFVSIGGLFTGMAPQFAAQAGGGRAGFGLMGLILAVVVLAAMLMAFVAASRAHAAPMGSPEAGLRRFAAVLQNKPFMLLIGAKVLQLVGLASLTASLLFFVKHVLRADESLITVYILASTVATIIAMPVWVAAGRRASKRSLYIAGCLGFAALTLSWLLAGPGEPMSLVVLRGLLAGVFSGGLLLMGQSILPDTIDYDCRRSGTRREGLYAGAYSFVEKASMAFGPLLVGLILQAFNFRPSTGPGVAQPAEALTGIYIGAALLPAALYALSVVPLLFYDLTEDKLKAAGPLPAPAAPTGGALLTPAARG